MSERRGPRGSIRHRSGRLLSAALLAFSLLAVLPAMDPAAGLSSLGGRPVALAVDPTPTPAVAGDPRSSGEGAGFGGSPLLAIGGMVAIGLLAAAATLVYVRATGGPRRD